MDYSSYLPEINVEDGKARVMNNFKLYLRLLGKFDGQKMADEITAAINANDIRATVQTAHALRGTAANLAFPEVNKLSTEIEALAKDDKSSSHLAQPLNEAVAALASKIEKLLAAE